MGNLIADGIFLLIGILLVIIGAKRGFFLSVLKLFRMIIAVAMAYWFGGKLGAVLGDKVFFKVVRRFVLDKVNGIYNDLSAEFNVNALVEKFPKFFMTEHLQGELNAIDGNGEELVNALTDSITTSISSFLGKLLGSILIFVATLIVVGIVCRLIKKLRERKTVFSSMDTILGGALGFVFAWILLLLVGSLLKLFFSESAFYTQSVVVKFFAESSLLDSIHFLNVGGWMNKWLEA